MIFINFVSFHFIFYVGFLTLDLEIFDFKGTLWKSKSYDWGYTTSRINHARIGGSMHGDIIQYCWQIQSSCDLEQGSKAWKVWKARELMWNPTLYGSLVRESRLVHDVDPSLLFLSHFCMWMSFCNWNGAQFNRTSILKIQWITNSSLFESFLCTDVILLSLARIMLIKLLI